MPANKKIQHIQASSGKGQYQIKAEAQYIGEDIIVLIWGGTRPHIGSVAISIPRPSLCNPHIISSTSSCFNFIGHKDEAIARLFSEKIAASQKRNTVVTAGIHIDDAKKDDLDKIMENAQNLCSKIIKKIEDQQ